MKICDPFRVEGHSLYILAINIRPLRGRSHIPNILIIIRRGSGDLSLVFECTLIKDDYFTINAFYNTNPKDSESNP
jgi:hypothetical protein